MVARRVGFCRRGVVPGALALGAAASSWTAVVTIGLSSTLSRREVEVDEAAINPIDVRDVPSLQRDAAVNAPRSEHRQMKNRNETRKGRTRRRETTADSGHYHPREIFVDGSAIPDRKLESGKKRRIQIDRNVLKNWKHIEDDDNYPNDDSTPQECLPMSAWQSHSYPNCNFIHEVDIQGRTRAGEFSYVASGGFNDVFRVDSIRLDSDVAVKVLSPGKKHLLGIPNKWEYSESNYDVVRRDALVSERLTNSSQALPIYGYCGFSEVVPWANGGTLAGALVSEWSRGDKDWKNITLTMRLRYAVDAATALADLHDLGVVHADLTIKQYLIRADGTLQLGDFNHGIFLERNATAPNTACTFQMTHNYGLTRAPEEYKHEPQTIAVDVWSLGSILYHLLTGRKVWDKTKKNAAQKAVIDGQLPEIDTTLVNVSDPTSSVLTKALDLCWVYDPRKRATAREVATFLQGSWRDMKE